MQAIPVIGKVFTALTGTGAGAAALSGLAASALTKTPGAPESKVAPTPDDETSRRAKLRLMQKEYGDKGRAATALTGGENKLG